MEATSERYKIPPCLFHLPKFLYQDELESLHRELIGPDVHGNSLPKYVIDHCPKDWRQR
jgi:hypothetical protein